MSEAIWTFEVNDIKGQAETLAKYKGKVLLIVNTASQCGYTPQYEGLNQLAEQYRSRGFEVLAFPCNQFGGQEPGSAQDIEQFCATRFSVKFPLFDKIEVNGVGAHPLYKHLKSEAPGLLGIEAIKWNFTKFLVGRDGMVIDRYAPSTKPEALRADIEKALG